jgi:neurofibromin 1
LLVGNIDVGLKHCLTLGYHEEPVLRTAFMRLMTNILKQGTRFGGLTSRRSTSSAKLYTEMLAGDSSNLALAVAIAETCPSNEVDEMSSLLFRLFEQKGSILALVKLLAEREIALTSA